MTSALLQQALEALEQRCGTQAEERQPGGLIDRLRDAVEAPQPPAQPERKPMTDTEIFRGYKSCTEANSYFGAFYKGAKFAEFFYGIEVTP